MEETKTDPLIPVWIVGELDVPESKLDELGAKDAVQEILEGAGFHVTYAEPS